MIKIKDSVYLNELEKFGFKYCFKDDVHVDFMYKPRKDFDIPLIIIESKTRILSIQGICDKYNTIENTLFDLQEAGLLEKVNQDN